MSNIKRDLMKKIEAKVLKKKQLTQQVARLKTVANLVADFFNEYEKIKKFDKHHTFYALALNRLSIQLRNLDRKCHVSLKTEDENVLVEIHWSSDFIQANNCEEVLSFDASSAIFQSSLEQM